MILTEVKSIESSGRGKVVTVEVSGPNFVPNYIRELRARGNALLAVGPVPASIDTVTDLAAGDIQRLTRVEVAGRIIDRDNITIREEYEIRVNQG